MPSITTHTNRGRTGVHVSHWPRLAVRGITPAEWPYREQLQDFSPFRFDRRFHPTRPDDEFGSGHYAGLRWRTNDEDDQCLGNGAVQALITEPGRG